MHNTGNPLPSKDILDLYDNSENIDQFTNSQLDEIPDRFGVKRLTLAGLIKRSMALRNEINDFSGAMTFKPEWTDVPMNVSEGVGGEGGALNLQAEALGNRTLFLKEFVEKTESLLSTHLNKNIPIYYPQGDGKDDTSFINELIEKYNTVLFAPSVYYIDPDVGVKCKNDTALYGSGFMSTILVALEKGATILELRNYIKGSIIKRDFSLGVKNDYVSNIRIDNLSIIMRHPETLDKLNYRQIAIDMRNCDRSFIGPGVYVGNTTLPGMPFTWEPNRRSMAQGYGLVYGTRNSNSIDYCGGVGGIAFSPKVYGARKNIVLDELQISPESAAHSTTIISPDLQIGVELISSNSRYNAGSVFENCLLQSLVKFTPEDKTIGLGIAGYNNKGSIKYLEGGTECDKVFELGSTSRESFIDVLYASVTGESSGEFSDYGLNNQIVAKQMKNVSGGKTTMGKVETWYNDSPLSRKVKSSFRNVTGSIPVVGDSGVTVERLSIGNYKIITSIPFKGEWGIHISAKISGESQFTYVYRNQTNNTVEINCKLGVNNGDPDEMYINIFQI